MNDFTKLDWPEKLKEIVRDSSLADQMGSADLKRTCKMLAGALVKVGERAAKAEQDLAKVTARSLELTGGRPPCWSYLHTQEALRLHEFLDFLVVRSGEVWAVCGKDQKSKRMHPIYEYFLKDYIDLSAEHHARMMTAHLRQTFLPRNVKA